MERRVKELLRDSVYKKFSFIEERQKADDLRKRTEILKKVHAFLSLNNTYQYSSQQLVLETYFTAEIPDYIQFRAYIKVQH